MKKAIRTISGITPLAVMLKPFTCPGTCIYCPNDPAVPKSYTRTSPVVLRAIDCDYDPEKQIKARLKILKLMGHPLDKIELIVMGGTFSAYPADYQEQFVKGCFDGLNGAASSDLETAQKANESASHRCVGLCLETRPDWCSQDHINNFLRFGCTRVELGVQCLDDVIYQKIGRGHKIEDVIKATQLLKDSSFKIFYHMMVGLPGSSPEYDMKMFKDVFENENFRPDGIKLYPTEVIAGTKLEELYKNKEYEPYTDEQIIELLIKLKILVPRYVRIARIMRDIPAEYVVAGSFHSHLRDAIKAEMLKRNLKCRCIRCREVGHFLHKGGSLDVSSIKLNDYRYAASSGQEIFLSFDDMTNDVLISLLRLRIPHKSFRPEIDSKTALIREVHTYGRELKIGQLAELDWQHKGFGQQLIQEAERIAREQFDMKKIIVISGVGTKQYFRTLGYSYDGPYMAKSL